MNNQETLEVLFYIFGFVFCIVLFCMVIFNEVPFTDSAYCKDYMLEHSNLTADQGQRYFVEEGICHEELDGGWFYTWYEVPMETVDLWRNEQ